MKSKLKRNPKGDTNDPLSFAMLLENGELDEAIATLMEVRNNRKRNRR